MEHTITYGRKIYPSEYNQQRSVIGSPEISPDGNLILRVGRESGLGWSQTEHVVLTPSEASHFLNACAIKLAKAEDRRKLGTS